MQQMQTGARLQPHQLLTHLEKDLLVVLAAAACAALVLDSTALTRCVNDLLLCCMHGDARCNRHVDAMAAVLKGVLVRGGLGKGKYRLLWRAGDLFCCAVVLRGGQRACSKLPEQMWVVMGAGRRIAAP